MRAEPRGQAGVLQAALQHRVQEDAGHRPIGYSLRLPRRRAWQLGLRRFASNPGGCNVAYDKASEVVAHRDLAKFAARFPQILSDARSSRTLHRALLASPPPSYSRRPSARFRGRTTADRGSLRHACRPRGGWIRPGFRFFVLCYFPGPLDRLRRIRTSRSEGTAAAPQGSAYS